MAPLPAARPSVFTTQGAPRLRQYRRAATGSSNVSKRAVGIRWRAIRSFEKALEPSIRAAAALGPNTVTPAAARRSARPATNGISGPTMVRSIRSCRAKPTMSSIASDAIGTHVACLAMPGLPGAAYKETTRGLRLMVHASACSRPPPPTSRTLMRRVLPARRARGARGRCAPRGSPHRARRNAASDGARPARAPPERARRRG